MSDAFPTCENCRFWDGGEYHSSEPGAGGALLGWCRRGPPSLTAQSLRHEPGAEYPNKEGAALFAARQRTAWPVTLGGDLCGKYEEHPYVTHRNRLEQQRAGEQDGLDDRYAAALAPSPFADSLDDEPF